MEQFTTIPHVDKPVSRMFFGTQSQAMCMGKDSTDVLDSVIDAGIQTLDTARVYGESEKVIGKWMELRKNRNDLVILSKGGHPTFFGKKRISKKEICADLEQSLRYLKTDYIDIYLLHRDDPAVDAGEITEILNELHKEGKIGAFGGSNWTVERIKEANAYAAAHDLIPFEVSSPNFGLAEQVRDPWDGTCVTITGDAAREDRKWYAETKMPVVAYSSLGRGLFSGKFTSADVSHIKDYLDRAAMQGYTSEENYERLRRCETLAKEKNCLVPQLALAWMYHQPLNVFTIISSTKTTRMKSNLEALNISLTEEECKYLNLED